MPIVLSFAYCNVAVLPVRNEPFHTSEQVTQLLFGEKLEVLQVNNRDWARIRCAWDDYEGWCKLSQIQVVSRREYSKPTKYLSDSNGGLLKFSNSTLYLPAGAELHIRNGEINPGYDQGKYKGTRLKLAGLIPTPELIKKNALLFMNAPYQWGGRTLAGIDCSGLSQNAYKMAGFPIPRDAKDQALIGLPVDFLVHARCGDLAFFEEKEGQINHVGILLDNETIIHATDTAGRVVIDRIDQGGIISISLKKRTHALRMVRRILPDS